MRMFHQIGRLRPFTLWLGLAGLSCNHDPTRHFSFDGPEWSDVLQPEEGGPFWTPIGFVGNSRDGTITPLDLRRGSLLGDQYGSPFTRPRVIATGEMRQLGQLVAWAPSDTEVQVFAADLAFGVLIEATYIEDMVAGEPLPPLPLASDPVFSDLDGSGDTSPRLSGLELRRGYTTTEDWLLTFDGESWIVVGSRSGRQARGAFAGEEYKTDNQELVFTLQGKATPGDTISLSTDTGLIEHDLGGLVLGLTELPDGERLLAAVWDPIEGQGYLTVFDLITKSVTGSLRLPEGAQPWRMAVDPDTWTVYTADAQLPSLWVVELDPAAPESSRLTELSLPAPAQAVAYLADPGEPEFERPAYRHLFVAPIDGTRLDLYDLDAETWIDVSPLDDRFGGIDLRSPVVGLSPTPLPILLQQAANHGARQREYGVLVTTFDGSLRFVDGRTGCLAIDSQGPRINYENGVFILSFTDRGNESNPQLYADPATGSQVIGARCGGVARSETWTLTYDGVRGGWRVQGSVSGIQENLLVEDQRYLTDDGGWSFLILSGTQPTTDGDEMVIGVLDGVLRISDATRQGATEPSIFELPAAPLAYTMDAGPTGGGWDVDRTQVHALVPITNGDFVAGVRVQGWKVERIYE
jgi:hypothetical protein